MMESNYSIAILSDQGLRAEFLSDTIRKEFNGSAEVHIIKSNKVNLLKNILDPVILLIDLMGMEKTSSQIIKPIKELNSEIKIIALHLYRTTMLVNPLFNMGVNGYVYYEPSREEIIHAIKTVISGKNYVPNYLVSS